MKQQNSLQGFYGRLLSQNHFGAFKLTETGYTSGQQLPKHSHALSYLCLTVHGRYSETSERTTQRCAPLTLAFHPAGAEHLVAFDSGEARLFNVEVEEQWMQRVRECRIGHDEPVYYRGGPPSWLACKLYKEYRSMDTLSGLMMEGLLLEIMVEASRSSSKQSKRKPPGWLFAARDLLHDSFSQNVSLKQIAESVNVHPVHLAVRFRNYYGSTIGDYVRKLRIDFACSRLVETDRSLIEIALAAGFCDQSHFSRTFKQIIGVSPSAYRLAFRKN
jgi:AraC family transcriptional regulator